MRQIAVIGAGYVGLVTGTCFAELGNHVTCIDVDAAKIEALQAGRLPFYEPGLLEMVLRNRHSGRLSFTVDVGEGLKGSEVVFIAVGTPMGEDGHADLRYVREAAAQIARTLDRDRIVVNKSTVPVDTGDLVSAIIREHNVSSYAVNVVSNPEFLREGSAIADFMSPDRIVVGSSDPASVEMMRTLYAPLSATMIVTDVRTAEMIKYTANAFLATKISFINEIANICERVGADVKSVAAGAGADKRIGTAFLNAGVGFGGSCFPKDVNALSRIATANGVVPRILEAVLEVNARQVEHVRDRVREACGGTLENKRIGLLGLAFKPNTDDTRESPAIRLAELFIEGGATVTAHDPVATDNARLRLGTSVTYTGDAYEALDDCDALVVATDWNEYKQLDLKIAKKLMRGSLLVDARNLYDPQQAVALGYEYLGVGRSAHGAAGGSPRKKADVAS